MTGAQLVDAAATAPVLIFGSLPPEARDLDVLAADAAPIQAALAEAGYTRRGPYEWARFADGGVDAVDVSAEWPRLDELLAEAVPLEGFMHLTRPAPHHDLLLLAQMLQRTGRFPAKRIARMKAARAGSERARELAPSWGVAEELERVLAGLPIEPRPRPRRPRIVGFSGIDGSGKSTQAKRLAATLEQLGYDVEIAWAPLGSSKLLHTIFGPVTTILGKLGRFQPQATPPLETGLEPNAGSVLRERSALAHRGWTTLIALTNGLFHARTAARAAAHGSVVIFDRYVLDSRVRLRFLYGDSGYRAQDAIIRLLSPRARRSFYLEVSAAESLARKDDRWSTADLERLVRLYRDLRDDSVTQLDGARPPDELAAEIARAVWLCLD